MLVQRFVWVSQSGDWTNPHSNSMGVSSTPYWTKTGKFFVEKRRGVGCGKLLGGGGEDLQSLQVKCGCDITCVWHSGDEPASAS